MKYAEIPELTQSDIDRFWSLVEKDVNGCWLWKGAKDKGGYGSFSLKDSSFRATRVSYQIKHGDVNPYLFVCHECNNPTCVNPEHLYLDTCSGNTQYAIDCGRRNNKGIKHSQVKLTEEQVRSIRSKPLMSQVELSKEFGVDTTTISNIVTRKTWRHII